MQTRTLLFAVTLFAFAACQEDMTDEKATWETTTKGWAARMEKMKKGHDELSAKVKAFTVPEGEAALAAEKAALDKALETGTGAIASGEKEVATAKSTIEGLISQGKKVRVEVALGTTKTTVDGALARAESLVSSASEALDMLSKKVEAAKGAAGAAKSRTDAWLAEMKKKGAAVLVDDLVFKGEAIDVDNSKVALSSLVATLKSCAELQGRADRGRAGRSGRPGHQARRGAQGVPGQQRRQRGGPGEGRRQRGEGRRREGLARRHHPLQVIPS